MRKFRIETIFCACGCGKPLNRFDSRNRERKYIYGHSCKGWNKGLLMSEDFKKKISEGHKGQIAWNKGKEWSLEVKKKISKNRKGKYIGENHYSFGKPALYGKSTRFKKGHKSWSEGIFGKDNPCWKENKVTPLKKWLRYHQKYLIWHKRIMTRDNYTCQVCHIRGGKLCVDHFPKSFVQIILEYNPKNYIEALEIKELWDINNGRVLCIKCHKLTLNFGGKIKGGGFYARTRTK